jgi:hypothetical protein
MVLFRYCLITLSPHTHYELAKLLHEGFYQAEIKKVKHEPTI